MNDRFQTVGNVIQVILPDGTNPDQYFDDATQGKGHKPDERQRWSSAPLYPTDLFAVTAYLVKKSGVLGFFHPDPFATDPRGHFQFGFNRKERDEIDDIAQKWARWPPQLAERSG